MSFLEEIKNIQKEALLKASKEWELSLPSYEWIEKIQSHIAKVVSYVSNGTYGTTSWQFRQGYLFIEGGNPWLEEAKLIQLGFKKYKSGWIKKIVK
ncbi:hypothetical protein [Caminibacter sp.]